MATHRTAKIPFTSLVKVGVWSNQKAKTTMATVYSQLQKQYPGKLIYIMNGGFFSMVPSIPACWGCKADGVVYANDWATTCYMVMRDKEIRFMKAGAMFPTGYPDGISGYPALIENGVKSPNYHEAPDGKSDRGRTMIGYNGTHLIMSCIADTSGTSDFTLKEELNYMLGLGCTYAMNLDGGGSSQCNFNGNKITSSRKVSNFVYAVVNPDDNTGTSTSGSVNIKKNIQTWLNSTYNAGLVVDGSLGNLSRLAIIKGMQKECGVVADGSWGPASQKAYKAISMSGKYNTVNKIKLVQCALYMKGYWGIEINGIFDSTMKNQVILYQRAMKLSVDGSVGPATIKSLFK